MPQTAVTRISAAVATRRSYELALCAHSNCKRYVGQCRRPLGPDESETPVSTQPSATGCPCGERLNQLALVGPGLPSAADDQVHPRTGLQPPSCPRGLRDHKTLAPL